MLQLSDLSWKQLLDSDACTTCGRCQAVCPAQNSGKPLNPKQIVGKVLQTMANPAGLSPLDLITPEEVWSCTTCAACIHECPVEIEIVDKIVELRRSLVEEGKVPDMAATALQGMAERGDPWLNPQSGRTRWAGDLKVAVAQPGEEVEFLYWVGCAGAFDAAAHPIARSMVKLLDKAGVSFKILGNSEQCSGDPARRLGDEGLFQRMARENVAKFRAHKVKKVLTHCAHCFNTMKNEYPELGAEFEVVHHSQFLARLVAQGKLKPARPLNDGVTFHDPCYLGRYNNEYEAPRAVIGAIPGAALAEMERHKDRSICCGGGGGHTWMDIRLGERIDGIRLDEAVQTRAKTVVTACPFCKIMLDSSAAAKGLQDQVRVRDVAEVLAEHLEE